MSFGSNHVAARVALDHGASVAVAVVFRSGVTGLALLAVVLAARAPLAGRRAALRRAPILGALIAVQSICIYSAVARMPVALALLTFNTYPMLYIVMTRVVGREPWPPARALAAIPVALVGLALALDVVGSLETFARRWVEIGAGVAFATAASLCFAALLYLTPRLLGGIDVRLRSCLALLSCAAMALAGAAATGALALPTSGAGWLGLALLTIFYGAAFTALFALQPRVTEASDLAVLNFEPVVVLLGGWAVLGQALAPRQIVGALVVVGAVAAIGTARR